MKTGDELGADFNIKLTQYNTPVNTARGEAKEIFMKLFGLNIKYSHFRTFLERYDMRRNNIPEEKIRKTKVYFITDDIDLFDKYRLAFNFCDVIKIHLQTVLRYYFIKRPKYKRWLNNIC